MKSKASGGTAQDSVSTQPYHAETAASVSRATPPTHVTATTRRLTASTATKVSYARIFHGTSRQPKLLSGGAFPLIFNAIQWTLT